MSELASEIPGYQALIEAAEFARQRYTETAEQSAPRPTAGRPGRWSPPARSFAWATSASAGPASGTRPRSSRGANSATRYDKDELVAPAMGDRTFAYGSLTLADRWLLQMVELAAHYDHDLAKAGGERGEVPPAEDGG